MRVRFGRGLRRGFAGAAIAAVAMAALTASQAPGMAFVLRGVTPPPGLPVDGGSVFNTTLPPLNPPGLPDATGSKTSARSDPLGVDGRSGIPATVLAAYQKAEAAIRHTDPQCHLKWQVLAAIGQVESGQADGGNVDARGNTLSPILGPPLDGGDGYARIPATATAFYDGSTGFAQAVGPMQFIPSTWTVWGADGDGDGTKDPNNVFDASLATADYLCAVGGDLAVPANLDRAILGYNHSQRYLDTVLAWYTHYLRGTTAIPDNRSHRTPAAAPALPAPRGSTSRGAPSSPGIPLPSAPASGDPAPPSPGPSASQPAPSPSGSSGPSPDPSPVCPVSPSPSPSATGGASPSPSPTPTPSPPTSGNASPSPTPSASPSPGPCAPASPSPSPPASPPPSPSATP